MDPLDNLGEQTTLSNPTSSKRRVEVFQKEAAGTTSKKDASRRPPDLTDGAMEAEISKLK